MVTHGAGMVQKPVAYMQKEDKLVLLENLARQRHF